MYPTFKDGLISSFPMIGEWLAWIPGNGRSILGGSYNWWSIWLYIISLTYTIPEDEGLLYLKSLCRCEFRTNLISHMDWGPPVGSPLLHACWMEKVQFRSLQRKQLGLQCCMDVEWKKYNLGLDRGNIQVLDKEDAIRWS